MMAVSLHAARRTVASAAYRRPAATAPLKRAHNPPQHRGRSAGVVVRAQDKYDGTSVQGSVDVDKLVKDLQEKWDAVENKTSVAVYGGASVVVLWLASTIVGAVNSIPLLPKLLELVGLGYTSWFVYRYLLFKSSREELVEDIEELKKRISGNE